MSLFTIDLSESLIRENRKSSAAQNALSAETDKLIDAQLALATQTAAADKAQILRTIGFTRYAEENVAQRNFLNEWGMLPQERIFTKDTLQKTCIRYGLRFLPTSAYKGSLDAGIPAAVEAFQKLNLSRPSHGGVRYGGCCYFICAPKESFELQKRPVDPLLLVQLDSDHFYLVHKWGNDLSIMRRLSTLFPWGVRLFALGFLVCAWTWHKTTMSDGHDASNVVCFFSFILLFPLFGIGMSFLTHTIQEREKNWDSDTK